MTLSRSPSVAMALAVCLQGCASAQHRPVLDTGDAASTIEGLDCPVEVDPDAPETSASFVVERNLAIMSGVIDGRTPRKVRRLVADHPEVTLIAMPFVPGSMHDEANLEAARLIRDAGLSTCVPDGGMIASGGVDFFIAGTGRSVGMGAQVGVHSWGTGSISGADVPVDAPDHQLYLDFYAEMGVGAEFYWFTLEAAGPDDIHWMTEDELDTYALLTD